MVLLLWENGAPGFENNKNEPEEAHFYAMGDHGVNMGDWSSYKSLNNWLERLADWLVDNNFLILMEIDEVFT